MSDEKPLDVLMHGLDGLLKSFHHAVFLIRQRRAPLDEEMLLRYFDHACAWCREPFGPEKREVLDRIISVMDLGDPFNLRNVVYACARCRRVRNGSGITGFMHQVLGPALSLEDDEIERRLRRVYDWIASYRPFTPTELFGSDADIYQTQIEALQDMKRVLIRLLASTEIRLGEELTVIPNAALSDSDILDAYEKRRQRVAAARERIQRRHSIQTGGSPVTSADLPAGIQIPLGKTSDPR